MSGVSIDHLISIVVLFIAVLLFIGLFNQTLSVAVNYQRNTSTATACGDLLDAMLLTSGIPPPATTTDTPIAFGLQDPSLTQYQLSPFSLMRLDSSSGAPISYQKTGLTYSNITTSPNNYLLYPYTDIINYSTAQTLLGINGTYGFQLTLTPTVNIAVAQTSHSTGPLSLSLQVTGTGFPLAYADVNYLLIPVVLSSSYPDFETIAHQAGTVETNSTGAASVTFSDFSLNPNLTYAFVAYAYLDGITGIGYYEPYPMGHQSIVPFLDPLFTQNVTLANSGDVPTFNNANTLYYNTTFILESQNYAIQETLLGSSNAYGSVTSGPGNLPGTISMGSYTPGILVIAYDNSGNSGVVMMPWGFSSLGFSLTFGGTPLNHGWVATDLRQVQINGVSYQAKLSLWSVQGSQESG